MSLAVTVLGSSTMFAVPQRAASGYLVQWEGHSLWLDAGAGTWQKLLSVMDYSELSGVLLTHRHPDHTTDVFQAVHARLLGRHGELAPIPLWAPRDTSDALVAFSPDVAKAFELRTISSADVLDIEGTRLSFTEMVHPVVTLGVRIEHEGRVLAYSADSGPAADFDALAHGAHAFLCEGTLVGDDEWEGHLNAAQAATIAARAGAERLLLTHLPPERDRELALREALVTYPTTKVEIAEDGVRYEV